MQLFAYFACSGRKKKTQKQQPQKACRLINLVHFCLCLCIFLCVTPTSACLRYLLACILCCDCPDPLFPSDLDPPPPSSLSSTRPSLTSLQGAVERPQAALPLPTRSLAHWCVAVRGPRGVESTGDGGSVAGLSCSTLTPSEGTDIRQLLRTPGRQRRSLGRCCTRVVARWRRINSNT